MADLRQSWMGWKAATRVLLWSVLLAVVNAAAVRRNAARELAVVQAKTVKELRDAGFRVFTYSVVHDEWVEIATPGITVATDIDWRERDWTPARIFGQDLRCIA